MMDRLPQTWRRSTISEVCHKPQYGWTSRSSTVGKIRYLRTTDLSSGIVNWAKVPFCQDEPPEFEKYQLAHDDIVVSRAGSIGLSYRIEHPPKNAVFASYLIRLRASGVQSKYLEYFLKSGEYWKQISDLAAGIAVQNINASKLSKIRIPLPPLPEQHLIVAKLDTLFAHVDRLKVRLEKIPILLKQFRQSVLTQAVTGKLTEEWRGRKEIVAWEESRIGDLFLVETGATPKRGDPKYYQNGSIAFIKSGLVKNELIYNSDEFITEVAIKETNAKIFPIDTLLVAMYGEGKTRGQVGWLKLEGATNQAIAALVSDELPLITKSFVFYFCLSQYNEIRSKAEGGNQPNLNLSKIKNWEIKMPSLHEQHEIVRRIESLFTIADRIEAGYKTLKKEIDQLPQAILAKAFRGELVRGDVEKEMKEYEEMGDGLSMAAEG